MSGPRWKLRLRRRWIGCLGLVMSGALLVPLVVVVAIGFDGTGYLEFPPRHLTVGNFVGVITSGGWRHAFFDSLEATALATVLAVVAGVLAAVGIRELRARWRPAALMVLVSPIIIPTIVLGIGQDYFFTRLGLAGSLWGIGLGQSILGFPIVLLLVVSGFSRFSDNLEPAARSLGAGWVRRTVLVLLPPVGWSIAAGLVFAFLASFDDLVIALFLSGPLSETVPVKLWNSIEFEATPILGAVAALILLIGICLVGLGSLARRPGRQGA